MKKFIIILITLFVVFGTLYSHNAQSGAATEVYVQDLKRQIAYLQAKVNNGTATAYERAQLQQLRARLAQLGR